VEFVLCVESGSIELLDSGATMTASERKIVSFPPVWKITRRHAIRKELFAALRQPGLRVVVDLSQRASLSYDDIDLLLDCAGRGAGCDFRFLVVAGSRSNRVLLEVTRIASLLPVCESMAEALDYSEGPTNPLTEHAIESVPRSA
jgi:hypothetical protein